MKKIFALLILLTAVFQLQAQTVIIDPPPSSPVAPPLANDTASLEHLSKDTAAVFSGENSANPAPISAPPKEEPASFPGGETAYFKFLQDSMQYPEVEWKQGIEGTVFVNFDVEKDGSITNVKIVRSVPGGPGLSQEAVRLISIMPKWRPATVDGQPVRINITIPVRFVVPPGKPSKKKKH